MQIVKVTGIDWHQRKLISRLYMDQRLIVRLDQGEIRNAKTGRGVRGVAV
jgi:hypothetical protein